MTLLHKSDNIAYKRLSNFATSGESIGGMANLSTPFFYKEYDRN